MDAMLAGGHSASAIARCVRRCRDEGAAVLRTPLPEARKEAFALALFASPTITAAAIAVGFSPKTAKQQGSRLLTSCLDLRRRVAGLYEEASRSVRRTVLDKGDALARATERHEARRLMMRAAWRLVGLTASEVGAELVRLAAEGHDVSLVDPVMKLVAERVPVPDADGKPLVSPNGRPVAALAYVARCEGVRFADEREEEAHLSRLLGWVPEPDGTGDREVSRLRGEIVRGPGDSGAAASVPAIRVPDDGAPFPAGEPQNPENKKPAPESTGTGLDGHGGEA